MDEIREIRDFLKDLWKNERAHILMLATSVVYAGFHTFSHVTLRYISAYTLALSRCILAWYPLYRLAKNEVRTGQVGGDPVFFNDWTTMGITALLGLLSATLNPILLFLGNHMAGASITAAMQPAVPIYTAFLSSICGLRSLTGTLIIGLTMTFVGSFAVTGISLDDLLDSTDMDEDTDRRFTGMLLLVFQGFSWAGYTILLEWVTKKTGMQPIKAYFNGVMWGLIFNMIVVLILYENLVLDNFRSMSWYGWIGIGYGAWLVSVFGHSTYSWAVTKLDGVTCSAYGGLQALLGMVLANLMIGDTLTPQKFLGGLLIIAGLIVVSYFDREKPKDRRPNHDANFELAPLEEEDELLEDEENSSSL